MTRFWALMKVSFLSMLRTFSVGGGRNKKKAISGFGALAIMAGVSVYISGVYSFLLASMLAPAGMLNLLPMLMAVMTVVMAFMFTVFVSGGVIFGGRDSDLVLALPVSAFEIMLSKVLALYLENLLITAFMLVPMAVAYMVSGGGGAVFLVLTLVCCVFIALVPTVLSLIVGYLVTWFSSRMEKKALISSILYFIFFAAVMVGSFQMQSYINGILANGEAIERVMNGPLLLFGLFGKACAGQIGALLGLIGITVIPFLLVVWLFSRGYKKIITRMQSHVGRRDYKLTTVAAQSQSRALFQKEAGKFFGTTIYLFNTGFGLVLLIIAGVAAIIKKEALVALLAQMAGAGAALDVFPMVVCVTAFLISTVCTSCVSLSLEGKNLWILKEAPISAKTVLFTKAYFNLALTTAGSLFAAVVFGYAFSLSLPQCLLLLLLNGALGWFVSFFGVAINLRYPKLDADNDTLVVKQSLSAFLGIFGGMGLILVGGLLYGFLLSRFLSFELFSLVAAVVLAALSALLMRALARKGTRRFLEL